MYKRAKGITSSLSVRCSTADEITERTHNFFYVEGCRRHVNLAITSPRMEILTHKIFGSHIVCVAHETAPAQNVFLAAARQTLMLNDPPWLL